MPESFEERTVIDAPRAQVWKVLEDVDGVTAWFAPIVASTTTGSGKGAQRALTFADGARTVEHFDVWEPSRSIAYHITGLEPVAPTSTWTLLDAGEGTEVRYRMVLEGPPEAAKGAQAQLQPLIRFILASLKHHVETGKRLEQPPA